MMKLTEWIEEVEEVEERKKILEMTKLTGSWLNLTGVRSGIRRLMN